MFYPSGFIFLSFAVRMAPEEKEKRQTKSGQEIKEFGNLNTQSSGLQNILSRPESSGARRRKSFSLLSIRWDVKCFA